MDIDTEYLREYCFQMVELHVDYVSMDVEKFTYLLGYYAAIYNYFSELYTFLIGRVRAYKEAGNTFKASRTRDKKDILEQVQKSTKLQYDSLSRKITVMDVEKDND